MDEKLQDYMHREYLEKLPEKDLNSLFGTVKIWKVQLDEMQKKLNEELHKLKMRKNNVDLATKDIEEIVAYIEGN